MVGWRLEAIGDVVCGSLSDWQRRNYLDLIGHTIQILPDPPPWQRRQSTSNWATTEPRRVAHPSNIAMFKGHSLT